jgi:hypothetical protein
MATRIRRPARGPFIEIRLPTLKSPPVVKLPEEKTGPIGILRVRRVPPSSLTPISLIPLANRRKGA